MGGSGPPGRRADAVVALAVVLGLVVLQWPLRLRTLSLLDEGAILQIARDVLDGRRPYADAVHYAFPGVFYLTAAAFAVAGTSVDTARALAVALFAATGALVYLLARWSHPRRVAAGVVVLAVVYRIWAYPHWQMLSYSTLAVALALAATAVFGAALPGRRRWPFAAAGAVAALGVLAKQDSGLAGAAVLGVAALGLRPAPGRSRLGTALAFTAGGVGVAAAAGAAVAAAGFLPDLLQEAVLAPLWGARHFAYPGRPALWPLFRPDPVLRANAFAYYPPILIDAWWRELGASAVFRSPVFDATLKLVYHLPWLLLAVAAPVGALRLARAPGDVRRQREALLVLLAAAFLAAFNRPHDWVHLLVLYLPTLLLLPWLGRLLAARLPRPAAVAAAGLAWTALAAAAVGSVALAVVLHRRYATPVTSARGTLYAEPAQAGAVQAALDALAAATPPDAPLLALPYHPLLNFLAARPGLSRFYAVWPVEPETRRDEQIIARLEAEPDALVVYSPTQVPHFARARDYAPTLFAHLADRFESGPALGGDFGGPLFFLLRREAPPAGRALLGPALAAARVVVEPTTGEARDATEAGRQNLVQEAVWPFARVLAVTTLPDAAVAVRLPLVPAPGERFRSAYGVDVDLGGLPGLRVRFSVTVDPGDGTALPALDAVIDPFAVPADRSWTPVDVDLDPWAGRAVDLVLRVTGPARAAPQRHRFGWADPRLVPAAAAGPASGAAPHARHGVGPAGSVRRP